MIKEDILRKIKDLLALGDKARNSSEEEAKAAVERHKAYGGES